MAILSTICHFLPQVFYKRLNLLLMALNLAYAIKTYIIYAACYHGYCPEKKPGIYLMLFASVLLMTAALFPTGKVKTIVEEKPEPITNEVQP